MPDSFSGSGLDGFAVVFAEFVDGNDLIAGEDAIEQAAFFRARDDQAEMDVEYPERDEHEHQAIVDQPQVLDVDPVGNPS